MPHTTTVPLLSRFRQTSALADAALTRAIAVFVVLAALWLAVVWAIAVP